MAVPVVPGRGDVEAPAAARVRRAVAGRRERRGRLRERGISVFQNGHIRGSRNP